MLEIPPKSKAPEWGREIFWSSSVDFNQLLCLCFVFWRVDVCVGVCVFFQWIFRLEWEDGNVLRRGDKTWRRILTEAKRGWKDPGHNASQCEPGCRWYFQSTSDNPDRRSSHYPTTTISCGLAAAAAVGATDRWKLEPKATFYYCHTHTKKRKQIRKLGRGQLKR